MVGYDNDFVECALLAQANVNFDEAIPLVDGSSPSGPPFAKEDVSLRHASCRLTYILFGDCSRLMVKELEEQEASAVLSASSRPQKVQELVAVRYTPTLLGYDNETPVTHVALLAEVVDPSSVAMARQMKGHVNVVEAPPGTGRHKDSSPDIGSYTRSIVVAVLFEALRCRAAALFLGQPSLRPGKGAATAIAEVREAIESLQASIPELNSRRVDFVSSWQDAWSEESKYYTNGEIKVMKGPLTDVFDLACKQTDNSISQTREAISTLQAHLLGSIRRKRMAPTPQDMWAYRLYDPQFSGSLPTPPVRGDLFSVRPVDASLGVAFRPSADVAQDLIFMGKVSNARGRLESTIIYDVPE
jgi:hypothetical protein